ncbi:uncharacterized protein METZ01_LOCUS6201 [marine metagenome]|uniref:RNA polymerase sigma-54 factor n=1 Tax=marine metagenome TaxID=408172 RepID=A0A381NFQ2_9ZZZZ|tara:strand:- start:1095 stop:2582 length:1488 start_codon:yes stop_codon:yes gene_type:complete
MPLQQKLQVKLSQKLILTPSLLQELKMLPMSTVELAEMLNQEMVENPLLDERSDEESNSEANTQEGDSQIPIDEVSPADEIQRTDKTAESSSESSGTENTWDDADIAYFFGEYLGEESRSTAHRDFGTLPPLENTLSTTTSLADHLTWQLSSSQHTEIIKEISTAVIGNLNEDGQLVASTEELCAMGPWTKTDVTKALEAVQQFDPIGVAARTLQECLWLQLEHLGFAGTITAQIVGEHLDLVQKRRLPELAKILGLTVDETKQHIEVISHLDPKPGARYDSSVSEHVIPDVLVVKREGVFVAVVNDEGLPKLRISPRYRGLISKDSKASVETKSYVREKYHSALWLLKSIDKRQATIQKVADSIVKLQAGFLENGIGELKPLVLRNVANDIEMHESTVSRVVNNKYMHTPQGLFEMKYFFNSGISNSYGESISSVTIKEKIRKIIEKENPEAPLSDAKIVTALGEEGLVLARRTIAKYREDLKIPTSTQRRVAY